MGLNSIKKKCFILFFNKGTQILSCIWLNHYYLKKEKKRSALPQSDRMLLPP